MAVYTCHRKNQHCFFFFLPPPSYKANKSPDKCRTAKDLSPLPYTGFVLMIPSTSSDDDVENYPHYYCICWSSHLLGRASESTHLVDLTTNSPKSLKEWKRLLLFKGLKCYFLAGFLMAKQFPHCVELLWSQTRIPK